MDMKNWSQPMISAYIEQLRASNDQKDREIAELKVLLEEKQKVNVSEDNDPGYIERLLCVIDNRDKEIKQLKGEERKLMALREKEEQSRLTQVQSLQKEIDSLNKRNPSTDLIESLKELIEEYSDDEAPRSYRSCECSYDYSHEAK